MPKKNRPKSKTETKSLIIETANKLFYQFGIKTTSMDLIAEKVGLTKRTLYYHFESKDDLISAYIAARDQPNLKAFQRWFKGQEGTLADKIMAIFKGIEQTTSHPKWRGCGFQRTAGELANKPGHPAIKIASEHKKNVENWLQQVLCEYELSHSQVLARQIALLMEGAFSAMLIHHDSEYILSAGAAAISLIHSAHRAE